MADEKFKSSKRGLVTKGIDAVKNLFAKGFFHILTGNFLNKAISMISKKSISKRLLN